MVAEGGNVWGKPALEIKGWYTWGLASNEEEEASFEERCALENIDLSIG